MIKKIQTSFVIYLLLLVISVPVVIPFLHKGYFPTHDGEWAIVRLGDMFRSLRDHQFPVRYSGYLNFGYGYPLFNFEYPAPSYIGIVFHVLHVGFVDTVKLLFAASVIISAFFMYFASSELWKNKVAGIISAVFYIYLPYRVVDLYARGSIGESLSFALFPAVLFFVIKLIDNNRSTSYLILGSICYAFLILMHNIMALLFSPILVVFILIKLFFGNRQRYREVVFFFLLSFGLSAFFWLPALLEKHYVLLSTVPIADRNIYFVKLSQLLIPRWGYGLPDHPDGFSYQIGLPQIVVYLISVFISLAFYIQKRKKNTEGFVHYAALFSASILICILLLFPFTAFIWKITPLLKEINYPWTLLGPTGFLISLLAGFLWTRSQPIQYIVIGLCVITILLVLPHAVPQSYFDKGDAFYLTNDATTTSSQELTPLWVKQKPNHRAEKKVEIVNGKGMIENIFSNSRIFSFTVNLQSKSLIRINIIYYPGWVMNIDGLHSRFTYNNMYGVMDVVVDEGKHTVRGEFVETPDRLLSNFITIGSMITLFVIILVSSLQTRSAKKFGL